MTFKRFLTKIISSVLLGISGYKMIYSILLIFFIYPQLSANSNAVGALIQEGLIGKMTAYLLTMVVDGVLGFFLLLKPAEEITVFHLIFGIILFGLSVFFIIKTPLTVDPIFFLLKETLNK